MCVRACVCACVHACICVCYREDIVLHCMHLHLSTTELSNYHLYLLSICPSAIYLVINVVICLPIVTYAGVQRACDIGVL